MLNIELLIDAVTRYDVSLDAERVRGMVTDDDGEWVRFCDIVEALRLANIEFEKAISRNIASENKTRENNTPKCPTIYIQAYQEGRMQWLSTWGFTDVNRDHLLLYKTHEFYYAAIRQNKILIVDMVPKWKAVILRWMGIK